MNGSGAVGAGSASGPWRVEVLIPAHRVVFALADDEVFEVHAAGSAATFRGYRTVGVDGAVHGMIAWPNTVLLTGPEPVVIDPGYATQGDILVGALARRGIEPDDVRTVLMTHLHSDHVSALPQLGSVVLHVHEVELAATHARAGRGWRDEAEARPLSGTLGEVLPGVRFIHTPAHTDGHVAYLVESDAGTVAVVGDTLGPEPAWYRDMALPEGHPRPEDHLAAFRAIAAERPARIIPGHYRPF